MAEKERKVIGIDFGSSQSSIAIMNIGSTSRPELLNLGGGRNGETMPTILALDENDDSVRAVGNAVREKYRGDDAMGLKYVSDFKRYFGGTEVEESDPPDVVDAKRNADKYARLYLAEMLQYLKEHFNVDTLDPSDYETCIAYPATWAEDSRVERLKQLVKDVGFPCSEDYGIRSIPEPVAAMQSLRVQDMLKFKFGNRPEYFMVIDFGGGTLDICIVKTDILGRKPTIISTSGNPALGGRDFDDILMKFFFRNNQDKIDRSKLTAADMRELRDKIKEAKESFSANFKDSEYQTQTLHLPRGQYDLALARQEFYNTCEDAGIFEKIKCCIREAMEKAGLTVDKISKVVLTGGSSKWPFVRKMVAEEFALGGDMIFLTETPFTDVANGCAIDIALPDGPPEKPGRWVKWKLLGDESWHEAKCLVEPSAGGVDGRSERQFLGKITGTKYLSSYTICLSWYRGFTKDDLRPDVPEIKEGKSDPFANEARICVFTRGNMPCFDKVRKAVRALSGEATEALEDSYDFYLTYHVSAGGACTYQFEILDRDAAKAESVRLREGAEKASALPQGTTDSGSIMPGQESYRGLLGLRERKLRKLRVEE